jgi:spermidine synthase
MDEQELSINKTRTGLLTTLAMLSGCCGLAYEILYMRALTTVLGDMFYVHAALLSTFLVGMGLGAKLAYRWSRWLWMFQILTGLYALALPIASRWLSQQPIMSQVTSSPLLTIFTTVGFILVPSLLIGFSIPLFSGYIKAYSPDRLSFQWIYRVYNLGAFLSILVVELLLVRRFGIRLSLAIIGAINLFNGVCLILMRTASVKPYVKNPRSFPRHTIVALALASLISAIFQMFFLKLSYLVFHPHRENFAVALSVTLLGLFIGAWLAARVRIRFETCLALVPCLIGLIYLNYLPILRLYQKTAPLMHSSEALILAYKFLFGCIFALGPMILFGALIPALMRKENKVAEESGHLLFVSSLANAAGYLVYALVGHVLLPTNVLLVLLACVAFLASLLAAGFRWRLAHKILAASGAVMVVLLMFHWEERNFYLANLLDRLRPDDEVIVFKSGAESATLVRSKDVDRISYNGHPSINVQENGIVNTAEVISGVIPALSAPRLDRALVLGLGTGITAGATSRIFNSTDVVEINNAFYKMMPYLSYANLDIEKNRSASLHLSDGRAFLVSKKGAYDAIINSIPAPTYFSASKIYTLEFYDRVTKALKPDGVFCTWLSIGEMSEDGVKTVLAALRRNFRYCDLRIMRGSYYMATCSNQPIYPRRFSDLPAQSNLVSQLQKGLHGLDLDEFFEDIRISENLFDHFSPSVPWENTDDHPILEFMVVRSFQLRKMGVDQFLKQQALFNIDPVRRDELKDVNRLVRRTAVFSQFGLGYFERNFVPILREEPNIAVLFLVFRAKYFTSQGELDKAITYLTEALRIKPDDAETHYSMANVLASQGRLDRAINHYRQALRIKPDFTAAREKLDIILKSKNKPD